MRAHNCDLLQCRKTVDGLEKWACEDCVPDTPDCIEYQNRRLRRNLSKKAERRAARSRKEKYRRMKRAAILAERKAAKQKRLAEKEAKKNKKEHPVLLRNKPCPLIPELVFIYFNGIRACVNYISLNKMTLQMISDAEDNR